ncbi:staphylococcal nuclease domain-containing protein 1 [Trichonephila clavata]|uniref:Staphylococcal nuclease domain-containing protein 1 n=1 Tax=Trichonephila clavata TaxID=2740835 RepID=A0A8X6KSB3_TRICU|nr:staphylococcal nuclease domain-containing protein 1 [Trichonephila clavata]
MTTQPPPTIVQGFGIVKQVNSGDTVVIRGQPKGGPPDEITITLTGLTAPKLGRRPNNNGEGATKDDKPFAWEAREFLRKKLIGKRVCFTYEKSNKGQTAPSTPAPNEKKPSREYGIVYNGTDTSAENVAESLVSEGLATPRHSARNNEYVQKLIELEDVAKAAGKGIHGPNQEDHVRDIRWNIENPQNFKDSFNLKPIKAIVEYVVDGSTFRVLLYSDDFPEHYYIKLMLSGIRCNGFTGDDQTPEPFAEEAKFFTECRLLQRDVEVLLESVSNKNFLGTILHPNGNITELLLSEGLAKCVDWSLQCVTSGLEKLRAAEKAAKEKRLRIWKDYAPSGPVIDVKEREFQGKVVEVINADAMVIKLADGSAKKIFLASIRPPRMGENNPDAGKARTRPLYEIPYMFEAREFLRKKLIGKKVNVRIDYKQPANLPFPEKTCCTVTIGGINVAEALVSKGLATVVRYRADDDQRSAHYDELLSAETKALKSLKGVHSKKEGKKETIRIVDLSGDLKLSKQYFPVIQRGGKFEAIVEFVASGSRLRIFLPRQNYLLTFLLGGITCARTSRETPNGSIPGDPYGDEALNYTKDLCLQREVQVEVEAMVKAGNFIGWLWIDNTNLSEALVREGFAEVHSTASRSAYFKALQAAQEDAQKKKLKMWENYEPVELEPKEDLTDRVLKYKKISVTENKEEPIDLVFYAQHYDDGPALEELMKELREELSTNPPLVGSYTPKKGEICAAKYSADDLWYRARILKVEGNRIQISFIDYGNKEFTTSTQLASLPAKYHTLQPCAHEYALAFIKLPKDADSAADARMAFCDEAANNPCLLLNVEYKSGSIPYVTLVTSDEKENIGKKLIEKGYVLAEKRREKKYQTIINEYVSAQDLAKKNRVNLWVYGDITEDDAKEFG